MARFDTSAAHTTAEVFALAGRLATTDEERDAIDAEYVQEIRYQLRLARRRASVFSGTATTPAVLRMAGWE